MRRIFYFFVFISSFLIAKEPTVYFATYPKSGTNWMMYCMTELTGRGWSLGLKNGLYTTAGVRADTSLKKFAHSHFARRIQKRANPNRDLFILLVRNYKECMTRRRGSFDAVLNKPEKNLFYFKNLQIFDNWNPKKRLLIYYEDFICDPEETLAKVMEFVQQPDEERLQQFMENFPMHRQKVLYYYQENRIGGTQSQGTDILHHSRNVPEEKLIRLDHYVQKKFPHLFEKYLSRYAQEDPL